MTNRDAQAADLVAHRPLNGLRVLELGSMYAAPTAGRMLRDFGASVVKVEQPGAGDYARQWKPQRDGLAMGFARLNAGKQSVAIDLHLDSGRELVARLASKVDVVIESFRPGRLEAWGMDYATLSADNPDLILTRVSGFGQTGPYRGRPGFGTVAETMSGFGFLNGWPDSPPTAPPFGFADSIAGISAAFGTTMALLRRENGGGGGVVDVALYEPLMFILGDAILNFTSTGEVMERRGNLSSATSPRGIYQAADGGWLSIAASNQSIAMRLFDAMGRHDLQEDPKFASNDARMTNDAELQEIIIAWVGSMPRQAALDLLEKFDVVVAPVNDSQDIARDEHFLERTLVELRNTPLGEVLMPGPILHFDDQEAPAYDRVPLVGEDTNPVLHQMLNLTDTELSSLAEQGVISREERTDEHA